MIVVWCALLALLSAGHAEAHGHGFTLKRVVVVMRHGVRPPTKPDPVRPGITPKTWPAWDVGWGELTHHGGLAIARVAQFDAKTYPTFVKDCASVRVVADIDQRTLRTAQIYADTMFASCGLSVEHGPVDRPDPRFSPYDVAPAAGMALAAAEAALPANGLAEMDARNAKRFATAGAILGCCTAPACLQGACSLTDIPTRFVDRNGAVKVEGALDAAASLAQTLLLEYADAKPMEQVGWGLADAATIRDLSALQAVAFDLTARPKPIADYGARALLGEVRHDLFDEDTAHYTLLLGHDGNIAYIGGALGLHWQGGDFPTDVVAPGAALIFELWQDRAGHQRVVVRYRSQGLDEIRNLTPLTAGASHRIAAYPAGDFSRRLAIIDQR